MNKLQAGIYWDKGQTPPRHLAIVFLRARQGATADGIHRALLSLTALWNGLVQGMVPDLPDVRVPSSHLAWLIGYGRRTFRHAGVARAVPAALRSPNTVARVMPGRGGAVFDGAGISYSPELGGNPAAEDIVVQFTGDTPLSVSRAVVESWKLLEIRQQGGDGTAALSIAAAFTGFNREDHRSWIGFHDGVSNMESGRERRAVVAVGERSGLSEADRWTIGGSYLAFMRLAVDLDLWETFDLNQQERLVGRAKVSGCPLLGVSEAGAGVTHAGCPVGTTNEVVQPGNDAYREPPAVVPPVLRVSHVQRANHHQGIPERRDSQRFYRQGYEYFEPPVSGKRLLQVGLNFISFQEHPERLLRTLNRETWLGEVNFGGDPSPEVITCYGAGIYFCPAAGEERFPGESMFL